MKKETFMIYALRIDKSSSTKPAEKGHGGGVVAVQGVVDSHRPGATVQLGHQSQVLLYTLWVKFTSNWISWEQT